MRYLFLLSTSCLLSVGCLVRGGGKPSDEDNQNENQQPVIESVSITPETGVVMGSSLTCYAVVNDAEDGSFEPDYEWRVNGIPVATTPGYTVSLSDGAAVGGVIQCVVTATDSGGRSVTANAEVTLENTAPNILEVNIIADTEPDYYNSSTLTCELTAEDPDQESLTDVSYVWKLEGSEFANGQSIDLSDYDVRPEDEIVCEVTVVDDSSASQSDSASVTLLNRDPIFEEPPSISGTPAFTTGPEADTLLTCGAQVTDPDNDVLEWAYEWSVNAQAHPETSESLQLDPSFIEVGVEVQCLLKVTDAFGASVEETLSVTVVNSEPELVDHEISPSSPVYADSNVMCSASGNDLNDGDISPTYAWENLTTGVSLGSSAGIVLSPSTASIGDEIQCTAAVVDSSADEVTSAVSVTVVNKAPQIDTPTEISPSINVNTGNTLVCIGDGSDIDQPQGLIETYQWINLSGSVTLGSTSNTYTVERYATDVGDSIECIYQVEDSGGLTATSSATVIIENSDPVISNLSISPSSPYNDQAITCSGLADDVDDSGTPSMTYTWIKDGSTISVGATISDPAVLQVVPGDVLECSAYVEDNNGASVAESVFVTIANRLPTAPNVQITPLAPEEGDEDLVCTASGSTDPDNQSLSYTYAWTSSLGGSYSGSTVPKNLTSEGEVWTCTATVSDGIDQITATGSVYIWPFCVYGECDFTLDLSNGSQIEMNLITAGEDPLGRYEITQDFYIGTTEITQAMAQGLLGTISTNSDAGVGDDYPYNKSTWHTLALLANEATARHNSLYGTGFSECYDCIGSGSNVVCEVNQNPYLCDGYRLPTEAEWEYAARSGTSSQFWTGAGVTLGGDYSSVSCGNGVDDTSVTILDGVSNPPLSDYAWFCGNIDDPNYNTRSKPVALKEPNGFGLYDMHGNSGEQSTSWTYLDYSYVYAFPERYLNPWHHDEAGDYSIYRGGTLASRGHEIGSSGGNKAILITSSNSDMGGRLVRTVLSLPSEPEVLLEPGFNDGNQPMQCVIAQESIDPNGLSVSYTFEWELNGQTYTGPLATTDYTNDTIPASELALGDTIRCIVRPDNGVDEGFEVIVENGVCDRTECLQSVPLPDGSGIDFVFIKEGPEPMDEYRIHQDFYMMTIELTQNMFYQLLGYEVHTSTFIDQDAIGPEMPASWLSFFEAAQAANALTERHNLVYADTLQECYDCTDTGSVIVCTERMAPKSCDGYSIPTEAEWMYALRSGSTADVWTGEGSELGGSPSVDQCGNGVDDTLVVVQDGASSPALSDYVWFCGNANDPDYIGIPKLGGLKLPNGFGLYDMYGNLREWTSDQYTGEVLSGNDPWMIGDETERTVKGGYWDNMPSEFTPETFVSINPSFKDSNSGVRFVRRIVTGPSQPEISFNTLSPLVNNTDLVCQIDVHAVDPDGDTVYYQFDWYKDGQPYFVDYTQYIGTPITTDNQYDTIPLSEVAPGTMWECHVTGRDMVHEGPAGTVVVNVPL